MGTRSITIFKDEFDGKGIDGHTICGIYRHYDSHPKAYGRKLAEFLKDRKLVNGYVVGQEEYKDCFNGMGSLAARMLGELENEHAAFSILTPGTYNEVGEEEYTYIIYGWVNEKPRMSIYLYDNLIFEGTADQFLNWVDSIHHS